MKFVKPVRPIDTVWIHCSAASRASIDADEVDSWHRKRGWDGIGYHYFIKTDGTLEEGRPLERTGAHVKGHNKRSIGICLNGLNVGDFTQAQFDTLRKLCRQIDDAYGGMRFRGHNEVAAKACPVFDYRKQLNLDRKGYIKDEEVVSPRPKPSPVDEPLLTSKQVVGLTSTVVSAGGAGFLASFSNLHIAIQLLIAAPISLALCGCVAYLGYRLWKRLNV